MATGHQPPSSTDLPGFAEVGTFVSALTPLVQGVDPEPRGAAGRARHVVVDELSNLIAAVIDADQEHTDGEVEWFIAMLAPFLSGMDRASIESVRRSGILNGRRSWLDRPSLLFERLDAADRISGGRRTAVYHRHVLDVAHAVAAADQGPSLVEVDAIARLRAMLLDRNAGIPGRGGMLVVPERGRAQNLHDGATGDLRPPGGRRSRPAPPVEDRQRDRIERTASRAQAAVDAASVPTHRDMEDVLAELHDLIGLGPVKAEVQLVSDLVAVQNLRAERGLPTTRTSNHLVFTGNPGTGKTTVARIVAELFAILGVVERGHLVEVDRSRMVAPYVGQTAERTREVCEEALDGVLLIDEAYALARGSEQDYGREAIDTLVKFMEDHRDRIVVIAAGYPDEMGDFLASNPGLESRFTRTIHFPDYADDDLVEIFRHIAATQHYRLDPAVLDAVREVVSGHERDRGFGNARVVRNLFEAALARQAQRLRGPDTPTDDELVTLLAEDIPLS